VEDKVLVLPGFLETTHGMLGCTGCHGGDGTANDRALAHEGMNAKPSAGTDSICQRCHAAEVAAFPRALHVNLRGIIDLQASEIALRANPTQLAALEEGLKNHCSACHTPTCGECHVSRPETAGGGFVRGHQFLGTPNTVLNCTACHGSRVEREFMGKTPEEFGERLQPDVHWIQGQLQCVDCHTYNWFHRPEKPYRHRYDDLGTPRCEDCHRPDQEEFQRNEFHRVHASTDEAETTLLACQVCHSQPYNNCWSCHVAKDAQGLPYFRTEASEFTFKIGRNPLPSERRPYDYVVLRHIPVDPETFAYYGEDVLSNFDALPTWKYATPHNIVRRAPQAETCSACHGRPELFLRAVDIPAAELPANQSVLVETVPGLELLTGESRTP